MSDEFLRRHLDASSDPLPDQDQDQKQDLALDLRGQIWPACLLLALKELNRSAVQVRAGVEKVQQGYCLRIDGHA